MYNNAIEGEPEGRWNVHPAQTCGDRPVNILRATARGDRVNVAGGNSLIKDSTIRSSIHKREQATVVVVPRESFRASKRSLESILSITGAGYKLVYVDGGSPRRVRRYLENQARKFQFTLIRTEHYLSPNEARNLGLQYVQSKYVVFIDNDVVVAPGWLDGLIECAEDTGAWVVGALYCIGEPVHQIVHMAGGESGIAEVDGKRTYHEHHDYVQEPLAEALNRVQRHETEIVEFHCMLVRRDAFNQTGPLDEALLSAPEHADFCLTVRQAGGSIYLEPRAVVTQLAPPPVAWSDLPFFALRWNPEWNRRSTHRFHEKWNLSDDSAYWQQLSSFLEHRSKMYYKTLGLQPVRTVLALFGEGKLSSFDAAIDRLAARLLVHPAEQRRARALPPIVYHTS